MATLIPVEVRGAATSDSLALLGLALSADTDVRAAVLGADVRDAATEAARHGASIVYLVDHPSLRDPLPEPRVRVIERLVRTHGIDTVLFPTSVLASDIAGSLAVSLDAGLNWDLSGLRLDGGRLVGERLALGDSVALRVGWQGVPRLGLMRPGIASPQATNTRGEIVPVEIVDDDHQTSVEILAREEQPRSATPLEDAEIIVAGGRGLGAAENFALVEDLAAALGGMVGASRAVVELGWYPQPAQIGQTGKTVAPRLYVACGISGAIHHKVGMQRSEVIVAVNTDRSAPIFDLCDLGIVGDATRLLPKLTSAIRARRTGSIPA
jgi:electron transfer flavoprotein alpha subunit